MKTTTCSYWFNKVFITFLLIAFSLKVFSQQKNIFLDRKFWKSNPTVIQIDSCIALGNNIEELNGYKFDPICWAILEKVDNKTIEYLLSFEGNSVNKITHDGRTYIFWAAYKNNVQLMNLLIEKGARMDVIDQHGYSLLNFSATTGQLNEEIYDICIGHGADVVNDKNNDGASPLLLISPYLKSLDMMNYFLDRGLSINDVDNQGNNLFVYTAKSGNKKIMNFLLENNIDPNVNNGSAMLFACRGTRRAKNKLGVFSYLDSVGVNCNALTNNNQNVIHLLASRSKDTSVFNFFLSKNVNINALDSKGNSPFMKAVEYNSKVMLSFLVAKGANFQCVNKKGNSTIHQVINRNSVELVDFIISLGADVNLINKDGNTALHLAAMKAKDDSILKILVEKGADKFIKTAFNETAYDLALENELLIEKELKIDLLK